MLPLIPFAGEVNHRKGQIDIDRETCMYQFFSWFHITPREIATRLKPRRCREAGTEFADWTCQLDVPHPYGFYLTSKKTATALHSCRSTAQGGSVCC